MKAALSVTAGPSETLVLTNLSDPIPGPTQVIIAAEATALNFSDTLIIRDRYQERPQRPFSPGAECAGTITSVGVDVKGVAVGERVCAYVPHGAAQQLVRADASAVVSIPAGVTCEQAASLIVAHGTVLYSLKVRAGLRAGETLVITGATGGVGRAAVELGTLLGAKIIACASGPAKLDLLRGQGVNLVVDSDAEDLKAFIKAHTDGRGADVVLDVTGGARAEALIRATGWGGRYLVAGFASGEIPKLALNLILLKSIDILGIHWSAWTRRDPDTHRLNTAWLLDQVAAGNIVPKIDARFPLERIGDALRMIEDRKVSGKVILTF